MKAGRVRNASMSDVARHAGVALGTVSNALNHPDKVADDTLRRIRAAIDELGFVRNNQARSLATGQSHSIGMIVTDLGNSFFVDMARGAEQGAQENNMTLLLANSDNTLAKEETYLDLFDQARFAGIVLAPFEASTEGLSRVRSHGRPVILMNVASDLADGCSVVVDNEQGGYIATRHLIDQGRRKIAFVGGPDRLEPLLQRRLGVERAIAEEAGRVSLEEIIVPAVNTPEGRAVGLQIVDRASSDRPDGIVAATDLLAMGMTQSFEGRIAVPDEIALIGYDNNHAAGESTIPISTIAQPGFELGGAAARLLCDEIENPATHTHQTVRLEPHLIVRRSSQSTATAQHS